MQNQMDINQNTNPVASTNGTTQQSPDMQVKVQNELLNQDLFKSLKLDSLTEEKKESLKQKMVDTIQGRIFAHIMDRLTKEDQEQFKKLLDTGDNKQTTDFIDSKVNIQDIVIQEVLLYKTEMIDNAQKIEEMIQSK